jgi:O-antigen ligase
MGYVPDNVKAAMPFSWEHRVEMWGYTAHRIFEVPLWGHGFDAVRTFDDTFSTRGIEAWAIVSLHPHNAGLHIWVETGVIGAVLAGLTVLAGGFALEEFSAKNRRQTMAAAGLISSALIISSTTYGLWQEWWWGTIILVATTILLIPEPEQL